MFVSPHRFFLSLVGIIVLLGTVFILANWDRSRGGTATKSVNPLPTRAELYRQMRRQRQVLFVYPAEENEVGKRYRRFADELTEKSWFLKVVPKSDQEVTREDLQGAAVYLIGTPHSNRILAMLAEQLPVVFHPNGFQFYHTIYSDSSDILSFVYPNPLDTRFPIYVTTGNSDTRLLRYTRQSFSLFSMVGDYRVRRGDHALVMGFFSQSPENRWGFDSDQHRNFAAETRLAATSAHYRIFLHKTPLNASEVLALSARQEQQLRRLKDFLGLSAIDEKIQYHVYASFEDKGLITGNTRLAHCNFKQSAVHTVIEPGIRGDDFRKDAQLILRHTMGEPALRVMELGLSVYFSQNWHGKGYEYWASRLYLSGNQPPLRDLLDNRMLNRESDLVMEPMAGTFVAYLLEKWGTTKFLHQYPTYQPSPEEAHKLEKGWLNYLQRLAEKYRSDISADRAAFPPNNDFQKGFCFAHEGYSIYNGYLSHKADRALEKLRELGSNAVSITPFSYMPDPRKPNFLRYSRSPGEENDESVIHAALTAHRLGMRVMLKPHLWIHRGWPGDIEMNSETDWQKFFDFYYRWIRHYALLAEMYHIEAFSLGVEMAQTTLQQPRRWRNLIARIRPLYSGELTYAANWGEEFENLSFWDALDVIGVNCYYPLSNEKAPDDTALRKGAEKVVNRIENMHNRFGKPVVITEIGFTASRAPWKQPHENARGKGVDLNAQKRCYRVVFQSLYRKPWLGGIYWWKWPSFLEYGGADNSDFTPNGKPAEEVVRQWYTKKW